MKFYSQVTLSHSLPGLSTGLIGVMIQMVLISKRFRRKLGTANLAQSVLFGIGGEFLFGWLCDYFPARRNNDQKEETAGNSRKNQPLLLNPAIFFY